MKRIMMMVAIAMWLTGCNNKPEIVYETTSSSSTTPQSISDTLKSMGADLRAEMETYRIRIKNRLDDMRDDLEEARAKRKAERDLKKQRMYDAAIEEKERRRRDLEEKWNGMENNMKNGWDKMENSVAAGWNKFKRDVDDFFTNDPTPYKHRRDSI